MTFLSPDAASTARREPIGRAPRPLSSLNCPAGSETLDEAGQLTPATAVPPRLFRCGIAAHPRPAHRVRPRQSRPNGWILATFESKARAIKVQASNVLFPVRKVRVDPDGKLRGTTTINC